MDSKLCAIIRIDGRIDICEVKSYLSTSKVLRILTGSVKKCKLLKLFNDRDTEPFDQFVKGRS